jgi:hypothetical protein
MDKGSFKRSWNIIYLLSFSVGLLQVPYTYIKWLGSIFNTVWEVLAYILRSKYVFIFSFFHFPIKSTKMICFFNPHRWSRKRLSVVVYHSRGIFHENVGSSRYKLPLFPTPALFLLWDYVVSHFWVGYGWWNFITHSSDRTTRGFSRSLALFIRLFL